MASTASWPAAAGGLFGIFNYAGGGVQDIVKYCVGIAVGGIFTIVATLMVYKDDKATRIFG